MSSEKKKRCPYCGKRVPYFSAYMSRRKAEYTCARCGKESRVVISKAVIPAFLICMFISLGVMAAWFFMKMTSNPLGIAAVIFPLLVFLLISPKYVRFEALKKYKNSMEARKAGLEYSDSFSISSLDEEKSASLEATGQFKINTDIFNEIKSERSSSKDKGKIDSDEITSHSAEAEKAENKNYVPVIDPVSEDHSSVDAPLKKIHSDSSHISRTRHHYIPAAEPEEDEPEQKTGDRFSGNRRF